MADDDQREKADGTMLYGPDGHTYFIPDSDLASYRLPDEQAARLQPRSSEEAEVSGFSTANPPAGTSFPLAVHGNFGRRDPGTTSFQPTILYQDVFLVFKNPQS